MILELDLFSGRPNPSWELGPEAAAELHARLEALPPDKSALRVREGLGYRGIFILPSSELGDVQEIIVSEGLVLVRSPKGERRLSDVSRAFERWLLETGRGKLEPAIYARVSREIDRS
jgi:hypothetical protein